MKSYKEYNIESYNKHAKEFSEKFKGLMELHRRAEFQKFIESLPGKRVLDLGAGGGDHSFYFKQQGLDVTAIDISSEMVKLCKEKGVNASVMDIEDMKFADESFDGIWAVTSLLHVPKANMPRIIDKLRSMLNKDGVLYVCLKEGEGESFYQDDENTKRFFAYWQKDEFLDLFEGKFELLQFERVQPKDKVFLQFFLRKHSFA